jgi:serine/threonine protein phosphatase PrpC
MLGYYNLSLQGESHKKDGTVCQDASRIEKIPCGWIIAAIADGVGSAKHSDVGSSLAVHTVIEHISESCPAEWSVSELTAALRAAYKSSLEKITAKADDDGNDLSEYDTTLTAAIYNGSRLVYAHVGDGGIITLSKNGDFSMLTAPQKGEEFNSVSPLRSEKSWEFGSNSDDDSICAFAMVTDGIYDVVCPWLLSQQEQKIYINYIRPFMDRNLLKAGTTEDFEIIKTEAEGFLDSERNQNITDDKTVAVVINTDVMPAVKPDEYYAEPDWARLQGENRKFLYSEDCGGESRK